MGAICLGPTGNTQGGHWFFSLMSRCRIIRHHWTALPMPQEVVHRITQIGHAQGMPSRITYANRWGDKISNHLEDFLYRILGLTTFNSSSSICQQVGF